MGEGVRHLREAGQGSWGLTECRAAGAATTGWHPASLRMQTRACQRTSLAWLQLALLMPPAPAAPTASFSPRLAAMAMPWRVTQPLPSLYSLMDSGMVAASHGCMTCEGGGGGGEVELGAVGLGCVEGVLGPQPHQGAAQQWQHLEDHRPL